MSDNAKMIFKMFLVLLLLLALAIGFTAYLVKLKM